MEVESSSCARNWRHRPLKTIQEAFCFKEHFAMGKQVHRITAYESRKTSHPVFQEIQKYWLTVKATDFPAGISTAANAREPVGLNRLVYRDIRESLEGEGAEPGAFDLMNKGITILALSVAIDSERGGIVDGAHTAKIIEHCNEDGTTNPKQYVEVYIRTGVEDDLITDIARGLNTSMQVAPKSIYNIDGVFDWLKKEVEGRPYEKLIAWRESDNRPYDVRDLISILELFNVFDFPNDVSKHPISAYEKWSIPLKKFAEDYEAHKKIGKVKNSKYYKLRPILNDALVLYDHIRHDFRHIHNLAGGRAGKMNIVEESAKPLEFPFAQLAANKYRLTKGACYPMLAAFRNMVEVDSRGTARWRGGFRSVLRLWEEAGPELVAETDNATEDIGRTPDHLGKNRKHWDGLHVKLQNRLLRAQLEAQRVRRAAS
jgi:hypothetical protein